MIRREAVAMELDALHSILRVLEPLTAEARERCLAAARCTYNDHASRQALASLAAAEVARA